MELNNSHDGTVNKKIWQEIAAGAGNATLVLSSLLVLYPMLELSGVPYGGVLPAALTAVIITTLAGGIFFRMPVVLYPSMGLNSYLFYELCISKAIPWQNIMGLCLLAGAILLFVTYKGWLNYLYHCLPEYLIEIIPGVMGLYLLYRGLVQSHVVIGSPMTVTMSGNIYEPVFLAAALGLVTAIAVSYSFRQLAIPAGIFTALLVLLIQGFVALPAQMLMLPDALLSATGQFNLCLEAVHIADYVTVLLLLVFDAMVAQNMWQEKDSEVSSGTESKRLFYLTAIGNIMGGCLGAGAMTAAEGAAISRGCGGKTGLAAKAACMLLLPVLFCGPLLREISQQPVITACGLVLAGGFLLEQYATGQGKSLLGDMHALAFWPRLMTLLLVPLWGDIAGGIGAGIILYILLAIWQGRAREITWGQYGLFAVFCLHFLLLI